MRVPANGSRDGPGIDQRSRWPESRSGSGRGALSMPEFTPESDICYQALVDQLSQLRRSTGQRARGPFGCRSYRSVQYPLLGAVPGRTLSSGPGSIRAMAAPGGSVLVLNSGSSSVKFALITAGTGERELGGLADKVGTPGAVLRIRRPADGSGKPLDSAEPLADGRRQAVISAILDRIAGSEEDLIGAGHRVVHGGERFRDSVLVDDDVIAAIRSFAPLAPLQNPADLAGIEAIRAARPELPQAAVFDTAFHQTMPASAFRYAVPEEWYTRYGVRRYGFHGTSHRFVSERAADLLGRPLGELRLVTAHLGNGCSAAAIRDGVSVDTTMGLTPLEGLVMGTRSGDVDPGVFAYLAGRTGLSAAELTETLNTRSGLLGLSGVGNDMLNILAAATG